MKTRHRFISRLFAAWTVAVVLAATACVPVTPIIVYVTPTPQPATEVVILPSSTATVTSTATLTPTQPLPTLLPTDLPTELPTAIPTELPTAIPTELPTALPTELPTAIPTELPTAIPPTPEPPTAPPPTFTPSATPPLPPGFVVPTLDAAPIGIQIDVNLSDSDWAEAMRRAEQLGVGWIKVQIAWNMLQPNGPGQRDDGFLRVVELHIEDANRRGFEVMVSIAKAPLWTRSVTNEDGPPDDPAHLAAFIALLLAEINPGTRLEDRAAYGEYIDAIEIWNEPNLRREWQGTLPFDGGGYMRLFAPAYQAVRAYSATMPVITAGLAPTGNTEGSIDDRAYMEQMFAAGLGNYPDVLIGIHPYSWANPPDAICCQAQGWDDDPHFFFADTMREYRAIRDRAGSGQRFWITEVGYASWDGYPGSPPPGSEWMLFTDRWEQALHTIRLLEIAQTAGDIQGTVLWNLNFANPVLMSQGDERTAYSLVVPGTLGNVDVNSTDRTERPLYWMLHDAVRPDVQLTSF